MKLQRILDWIDRFLDTSGFDDVSNNGLQISRLGTDVRKVAFAVDASLASVKAAADSGADLLVVHHGISWGGGIRRITGATRDIVGAAIQADMALAAYHLPLDANKKAGNNCEIARALGMKRLRPAFEYHGNVIGVIGEKDGWRIGVCSGGAGSFAPEAKRLGCDVFITGEADWAETIAAENVSMPMICAGHYETEVYGVKALMRELAAKFRVETVFIERKQT